MSVASKQRTLKPGWKGRTYDLGRMSVQDLLMSYATYPAIQVYAAMALVATVLAVAQTERGGRTALAALSMVLLYPLVEYGLHRYVLHARILYKSHLTAALWKGIHFDHHQDPHRLEVLFGSLTNTLPLILALALPIGWAVDGLAGAAAALAGATTLMCLYEFCHCMRHPNVKPKSPFLRRIKQRHMAHHFHDETSNFGITSPLIDHLAGTLSDETRGRPRSPAVFNLGHDAEETKRYPWVAELTGTPPRDCPPGLWDGLWDKEDRP
ncbi:MAG: sterol desaturase family protein [Alphaproteobacteria bacterium]